MQSALHLLRRQWDRGRPSAGRVGRVHVGADDAGGTDCATNADKVRRDVKDELLQHLKDYMQGFMNDPAHKSSADGSPDGRVFWPDAAGNPTDAWGSPLAHRKLFEWRAGGPGGRIDADGARAFLAAIGMPQTVCSTSVAEGIIHQMDKGGDDNLTTWDEYLNSMFSIGPVADTPTVDPTIAQIVAEGGALPTGGGGKGKGLLLGSALQRAVDAAAETNQNRTLAQRLAAKIATSTAAPPDIAVPPIKPTPALAGVALGGVLLAVGRALPWVALPVAIGTAWSFGPWVYAKVRKVF